MVIDAWTDEQLAAAQPIVEQYMKHAGAFSITARALKRILISTGDARQMIVDLMEEEIASCGGCDWSKTEPGGAS